ncbi:MAG: isoamylase early set domain-containing protein [Verrucomicrobia bacterium]|jgi:1,4-alpha-glucan branching enzyme|nr:isoamylase early set domain-containing protein [Verrucomicrobiota bacterium]MDI9371951.1 isoamylase early set domain-containing protein [Verrucomicrobiota bacterium]HNZ76485.1 isoamylase early set domain-containing protein [Verrucomicrobiota bacterium]HOC50214.1 isoamylase early set domain-containing protein [Verrucomicrobiota bacterium]HOH40860.1 isoamylase early set domain-containing protein [Verrucomicrobiota bacterium]
MAKQVKASPKQKFSLSAPEAKSVLLVGDFTQWQQQAIRMRKGKNGVWTTSVALPPGKHNYRFLVDGEWRDDPECVLRTGNPYGTHNMVREVG